MSSNPCRVELGVRNTSVLSHTWTKNKSVYIYNSLNYSEHFVIGYSRTQFIWIIYMYINSLVWFGLCCLMIPGLSKDIRCHVWPYFFINLQIARSDIRPHIKWLSVWCLHMVTSIFLWGVSGYIWINILTYDPWGRISIVPLVQHPPSNQTPNCTMYLPNVVRLCQL